MSRIVILDSGPVGMVTNPKTTSAESQEYKLWSQARRAGKPTADPKALDGDVILAAQAKLEENKGNEIIIATTNVGHLSQFVDAREWRLIQ